MADLAEPRLAASEPIKPPASSVGIIGWLRANLFSSIPNTILTLLALFVLVRTVPAMIEWLFLDATWTASIGRECRTGAEGGACWAFIAEKWRFILFGRFPYEEHWRPVIVCFVFIALFLASCDRRLWGKKLALIWIGGLVLNAVLMWGGRISVPVGVLIAIVAAAVLFVLGGREDLAPEIRAWVRRGAGLAIALGLFGVFTGFLWLDETVFAVRTGMTYVETALWNGLPLTLILATVGMVFAFPLAILLALGRRSHMPAVRAICVAYIELIRGVPLVTLLFMSSAMLPLFLPTGITIDKLLRAQVAIILFAAAYLAEIMRGGLQSLPKGQYEAADALGLSYWRATRLIILPQALAAVIPPLVNTFIGVFKDTALVIIIGIFDLLTTANSAITDPNWRGFSTEAYLFVAAIYWIFCWFMSKYSQWLEADLNKARRR